MHLGRAWRCSPHNLAAQGTAAPVSAMLPSSHDRDLARYAGLGFQFAATMVVFAGAGWWLDSTLDTSPWCLLAGCLLGSVGATVALVRAVPPPRSGPRK